MDENFAVRQITKEDYTAIYNLIKVAFETAEHRDGDEQNFAVNLRLGENYIPELDLVAELDGNLIGHIMFTKTYVTKPDGIRYDTLLVAPLAVQLEYRGVGIGSTLMNEGFRIAQILGYQSAFLIGAPNYYKRFGYNFTHLHGINHEYLPAEYVMVKEFVPAALDGVTGLINM